MTGPLIVRLFCDTSDGVHTDICSDDGNFRTKFIGEIGEDLVSCCASSNDEQKEHVAYIEALRCFVAREFEVVHAESFSKELKQICVQFGFSVTIRRSNYWDEDNCYARLLFLVCWKSM